MDVKILVPNNLDLEELAKKFPYNYLPTKERSAEYLYFICGTLAALRTKRRYDKKDTGFTNMCAKWLRKIHANSDLLIGYLIETRVIECDCKSIDGIKCFGYRFLEPYTKVPYREMEITSYRLKKAIRGQRKTQIKHRMKEIWAHMHIVKWYLKYGLDIDFDAAGCWVNDFYEQNMLEFSTMSLSDNMIQKKQEILWDKCNAMFYYIDRIKKKKYDEWEFSVDTPGRRLHGMFSYTKKELRMFTTYDGKKLVAVDWKNSQPYFSTLLLEPEFWQSKKVKTRKLQLIDIAPEMYKVYRENGTMNRIITMLEKSKRLAQLDVSTGRYKNLAQTGEIYEYLLREMPNNLSRRFKAIHGCRFADRRAIKKETLRIMYCCNSEARKPFYETVRAFRSMFPQVARLFELIKEGNYEWLPRILQRVESRLILLEVCKALAQEYPQMPLFTIHDSIVTTEGNEHAVKEVTERILTERVGCPPVLAFEYWLPENAYPIETNNNYICENEEYEDLEII
jgi:hypothetical protein